MKKRFTRLAALLLCLVMLFVSGCGNKTTTTPTTPSTPAQQTPTTQQPTQQPTQPDKQEVRNISLVVGTLTGAIGQLCQAMSATVNQLDSSINMAAVTSGGSVDNVELLRNDESELAYFVSSVAYKAYNGLAEFESAGTFDDLRLMFTCYAAIPAIAVRADSGIYTIDDLVGKTVAIGPNGAGLDQVARTMLEVGYGYADKIKIVNMAWADGANTLRDGNIDAQLVYMTGPVSASFYTELDSTTEIRLLEWDIDRIMPNIEKDYSYFTMVEKFLASSMKNSQPDFDAPSLYSNVYCKKSMDEDLVYEIISTIFDNLDTVMTYHSMAQAMSIEGGLNSGSLGVPIHTGAAKYFKEHNVWNDSFVTD